MSGKVSPLTGTIAGDRLLDYLIAGGPTAGTTAKESTDA